jgi:hypothetical protein
MNKKGNPENLIAAQPGNLNAVKSGAHSPRLIQARAHEIVEELSRVAELDAAGRIVLGVVARLTAVIEAIDRDLDAGGVTDKKGEERYLLRRRESVSRRLLDAHDRLVEAINRARRQSAFGSAAGVEAETSDYIRQLQAIALGHDPDARTADRLVANRILIDLGPKGTSRHYQPKALPYASDPEVEVARAELERAERARYIAGLRNEATLSLLG